ncbi:hypothetical protein [Pedobacter duraquae]|uniref:Uncharacterized protein n=1 Tax=Pedobacter duraquae TaxID=425511 RepID=A0A4R6INE0_9SPHI|nr:hypothetical protein [Pedobacter duraquae]TDO23764.1 hypothetical protein CLV32_0049 [Pedobacter duraquae]
METLTANEHKVSEIIIGSEKFTVTDKRVIFNHPNNNAFIGINELRGAEMKEMDVKYHRFKPNYQALSPLVGLFWVAVMYVYICTTEPQFGFGDLTPLFLAFFWCIGLLPATLIVFYIIQSMTSYNKRQILVNIIKTDNSFWLNQYYDLTCVDQLRELTATINNAIYE